MHKVQRRNGFSDRNSIQSINTTIQTDELDIRTRNAIYSAITFLYNGVSNHLTRCSTLDYQKNFCAFVLSEIYADHFDYRERYNVDDIFIIIKNTVLKDQYDDVLTLIEALAQFWDNDFSDEVFIITPYKTSFVLFNSVFEEEYVGYRFIGDIIVPISDKNEINAIEEAFKNPYDEVRKHVDKASILLSDRNNPDYENSIKESICAVEAMCEIILGAKGSEATLGAMLKKFEKNGIKIHSALGKAFEILYGYTNDSNGIRHAGDLGGPESTFEEAKFMLVSCCAFINYLTAVQAKL